jgi:hypothetical protein
MKNKYAKGAVAPTQAILALNFAQARAILLKGKSRRANAWHEVIRRPVGAPAPLKSNRTAGATTQ